jgi:hypothetical protein
LNLACLDVGDRVSRISLRKDCSSLGNGHDSSALADDGKKFPWVNVGFFLRGRGWRHQWLFLRGATLLNTFSEASHSRWSLLLRIENNVA